MEINQSIHLGAEAVTIIDNYLLNQQLGGKYSQWLDRYSKHPSEHTDTFLFGHVVQSMFSGGMKGVVVDQWMPRMKKAFFDWDVIRIAGLSQQEIENLINSKQVIRNEDKLKAVVKNAIIVLNLIAKYGSFGKYLASFRDTETLATDLQQFKFLKEVTVQDFLRNIGYDAAKPDRHITRWLMRMNIVDDSYEVSQILKTVYTIAEAAKISRARFDSAIYLFCANRQDVLKSGGICSLTPHCQKCPITEICPGNSLAENIAPAQTIKTKIKNMKTKLNSSPTPKLDQWTVWNTFYEGKSLEETKMINPFAVPSWLNEPIGHDGSRSRIDSIQVLFSDAKSVRIERIESLGRNNGKYVAFRAIVHGYAVWDGEELKRTIKSFSEF